MQPHYYMEWRCHLCRTLQFPVKPIVYCRVCQRYFHHDTRQEIPLIRFCPICLSDEVTLCFFDRLFCRRCTEFYHRITLKRCLPSDAIYVEEQEELYHQYVVHFT